MRLLTGCALLLLALGVRAGELPSAKPVEFGLDAARIAQSRHAEGAPEQPPA